MKKEYVICFLAEGFGGTKVINPFTGKKFPTPAAAEIGVVHLLKDTSVIKEYFILPCYSKE